MTKEEALAAIKLLSALESWAFSNKTMLPDYLHDDLCRSMKVLERIVLERSQENYRYSTALPGAFAKDGT